MDSHSERATLNIESSETAALPLKTRNSKPKRGDLSSAADKEASQRLVSGDSGGSSSGVGGGTSSVSGVAVTIIDAPQRPDSIVIHGIADESHPNPAEQHVEYVVIVNFDDRYLKTAPGVLRFLQVVLSALALVCLTSCGSTHTSYLTLPLAWHLRAFVFVSICGLLTSVMLLIIHLTGLISMLPINWHFFDAVVYGAIAFLYLFGTSLVLSAVDYYQKLHSDVSQWTIEQLIVTVVLGYICLLLYAATALHGYRKYRGAGQFRRYRFQNQNSGRSQQCDSGDGEGAAEAVA